MSSPHSVFNPLAEAEFVSSKPLAHNGEQNNAAPMAAYGNI